MAGMLEGKTALITGAGRGIGRAAALLFAAEGARVAVADQMADGAAETVALINKAGGQALAITSDVTKPGEVASMVSRFDGPTRSTPQQNTSGVKASAASTA